LKSQEKNRSEKIRMQKGAVRAKAVNMKNVSSHNTSKVRGKAQRKAGNLIRNHAQVTKSTEERIWKGEKKTNL